MNNEFYRFVMNQTIWRPWTKL